MSEQATPAEQPLMPPYGMDYRTWFDNKAKLGKKKAAVMAAVDTIPKNGYNEEDNFYFSRESDINDMLRKLLFDNNLGFDVEYVDRNLRDNGKIIEVKLDITWTDLETGYFETRKWLGTGFDYVEKGLYKAYTGGAKYYLMRNFLMSQGDTDPEHGRKKKDPEPEQKQEAPPVEAPKETPPQKTGGSRKQADNKPKPEDKPTDAPQEAVTTPEEPGRPNGAESQKETAGGDTGADAGTNGVTPDQVAKIKQHTLTLAAFSDDRNKRAAQDAVYAALTIKPELRDWGARVKGMKDSGDMIIALTEREAEKAIEYLANWVEVKQKQREGKANA